MELSSAMATPWQRQAETGSGYWTAAEWAALPLHRQALALACMEDRDVVAQAAIVARATGRGVWEVVAAWAALFEAVVA